jgi:cysteine desulfurase
MYANNETGVLHPIPEISTLARCAGAAVFCDASQVPGRVALDVLDLGIDAVVISGHKIHGIRGAAALAYDARTTPRLRPLLFGGGHEFGLRAGTENTPAIVALVEALRIAVSSLPGQAAFLYQLREEFEHRLSESVEGITWLGDPVQRLPNTSSFCLTARRVPDVLARCKDLVVSTGSACGSDGGRPSPVLLAMGVPRTAALNSIRVSFGRFNTQSDAHFAADTLSKAIRKTPLIE